MKLSSCSIWLALSATVFGLTPAEWRSQSIYQIVTDRFARTDGSTTANCVPSRAVYCGGTWQGIIKKLDYIQQMGFTAIWISAITAQLEGGTAYGEAYHGYWQTNMDNVNSRFGTEDDLKALSNALHDRNMVSQHSFTSSTGFN
jgi:alpha-amylase